MIDKEHITYQITNIDKQTWRKFKANVSLRGFDTIGSCLKAFIRDYSEGKCSVKK